MITRCPFGITWHLSTGETADGFKSYLRSLRPLGQHMTLHNVHPYCKKQTWVAALYVGHMLHLGLFSATKSTKNKQLELKLVQNME